MSDERERELLKALRDLVRGIAPHSDWACARCGSQTPISGFSCAYHRAVDVLAEVKEAA